MSDENDDLEDILEQATGDAVAIQAPKNAVAVASDGNVVPLHAATGANIKRGPGRPKKINPKPTVDDLTYHAETAKQRQAFIDTDPLVQTAISRTEAIDTLQRVKEQVAREAASLQFAKIEEEKYGRDTSQMSSRRIAALREIASIELEIKKLGVTMIDLKGERFQKIFQFFLETVHEAAAATLTPEQVDLLLNRLGTKLEGWEEKAQSL
jgi:hypothetical protein